MSTRGIKTLCRFGMFMTNECDGQLVQIRKLGIFALDASTLMMGMIQ